MYDFYNRQNLLKYLEKRKYHPHMENLAYANYVAISKNTLGELN